MQELILEAAWANGYSGRNFRDHRAVMRAAFGSSIEASSVSNIDIGGILSNVANKFLLNGSTASSESGETSVRFEMSSDFKTRYQLPSHW